MPEKSGSVKRCSRWVVTSTPAFSLVQCLHFMHSLHIVLRPDPLGSHKSLSDIVLVQELAKFAIDTQVKLVSWSSTRGRYAYYNRPHEKYMHTAHRGETTGDTAQFNNTTVHDYNPVVVSNEPVLIEHSKVRSNELVTHFQIASSASSR